MITILIILFLALVAWFIMYCLCSVSDDPDDEIKRICEQKRFEAGKGSVDRYV